VLAIGFLIIATLVVTGLRSFAAYKAERRDVEAALTRDRDLLIDGGDPTEDLYRQKTRTESDYRLADLHSRAVEMLEKAQSKSDEKRSGNEARERFRQFQVLRDDALFQDTQITGLDPSENVAVVRTATWAALELYAAHSQGAERWTLGPLHPSLTRTEHEDVARGCYEMLMVLAEVVAQPLPGESPTLQARSALQILERAAVLRPQATHAFYSRKAACLERLGDADAAKRDRTAAERSQPDGAFDHFLTGIEQYKRGYMGQAKRHFGAALQAQPNHFWAQCLLAICDLNDRPPNPDGAKAYLTACLQTHPELSWLYILRGFASGELASRAPRPVEAAENFADAEADYDAALDRDPDGKFRYALLANRGLVRLHCGKLEEAVADLEEAIALDPRQLSARVTLAQVYRQRQQLDRAIEELDRAVALKPNLAPLYRTRARWRLERPKVTPNIRALALADLDQAVNLGVPKSQEQGRDLVEKARILLMEKRFQEALDACDRALKFDSKDAGVHRYRVGALLELKRERDAIDACDLYLLTGQKSPDLLGLRGLAKARRNDFAAAIDDYTLALALEPAAPVFHARRGWAYLVSGAAQLALRDFEEAIRLDPSSGDAYSGRGSALVALGRCREAVADAFESLNHGESEARLHYSAARIFALAAESANKESRSHNPSEPAQVRTYQDHALTLLGQAIERTPPSGRVAFWRGVVQPDQAFTAIRRLPAYARIASVASPQNGQ
jgi:tetratricopeptide (TPR) repeat protein